jgi:hypothetical protein
LAELRRPKKERGRREKDEENTLAASGSSINTGPAVRLVPERRSRLVTAAYLLVRTRFGEAWTAFRLHQNVSIRAKFWQLLTGEKPLRRHKHCIWQSDLTVAMAITITVHTLVAESD